MLGLRYDEEKAYTLASSVMQTICHTAYRTSIELAREKGAFPFLDRKIYLQGAFIKSLPEDIRSDIAKSGIRNSHLIAIAPTGTISLLANNISNSLEPVFDFHYKRRILEKDSEYADHDLSDYALRRWKEIKTDETLPSQFIDAHSLPPLSHLKMQAALQPHVDNAISKTINIPEDYDFSSFLSIYEQAFQMGLKGCTTFRPNPVTGKVLSTDDTISERDAHCCGIEREAD